ncbi:MULTISPECIES: DEAD/DEAH box helicase [unclassified Paenibacillus]|uniref:DEAD/DEAH box helicase n=1 Tax=unclassified Paenibacillus TaxID=185978 RepID=UPI002404F6B6|nr:MULTISPECIES: DEAD/DEAH box helicase [unclassified Paenibacillus]MDF9842684.1 ATP-dependent RNA helicase DeaD [Paenibacillus sp. PastF-2]MDF9849109.1 ATP-dependent RNA helicase DeaD [Paenibacillus sp. PastM-2]MDF9855845.1 ATP-dependent RNA helicase DeaD [Paenibacillus sp. PastF-1]MDH6480951.1 ATP-dependent RNA helicase DeaD [Paenibacillus sp. PastH-2]MDH6508536.1 ATP-dependent RNA helicase DeaD [Paenibacillus sp. PastM-3]
MKTFAEFGLEPKVLQAITELGFEESTPIQEQAIPIALTGADMIGQAQTGTGKTAAFGIPLISKISREDERITALVMTPTRELAIQVAEEIGKLSRFKGLRSLAIYGGQDIGRQIRGLKKKPQIIIGTPGRLLDHINRKTIRLDDVQTIVLDEADEMLDMGFMEDIQSILKLVPEERQTMLFSATMPPNIQRLAQQFLKNPQHVSVIPKQISAPLIDQAYIEVPERQKFEALSRLIDMESPELAIVFGRTKRRVDELAEGLQKRGYSADGLHGDLSQNQRDAVMRKFRDGSIDVLVATDVAARGLDVSGVTHVINFDLPQDPESYVHRIGRTGRAGKEGTAWSFVTPREIDHLHLIERVTRHRITRKPLPTMAEAIEGKQRITAERLLAMVETGDQLNEYKGIAIQLLEQYDSVQLLSAAMKLLTGDSKDAQVELTPEDPIRAKRRGGKYDIRSGRKPNGGYGGNRSGGSGGGYKGNREGGSYGGGYKGNRDNAGGTTRGGYSSGYGGNSSSGGYKGNRDDAARSSERKPYNRPSGTGTRPAKREDSDN